MVRFVLLVDSVEFRGALAFGDRSHTTGAFLVSLVLKVVSSYTPLCLSKLLLSR